MRPLLGVQVPFLDETVIDERAALWRRKFAPGTPCDQEVDMTEVVEAIDGFEIGRYKVRFGVDVLPSNVLGATTFDVSTSTIHMDFSNETYALMDRDGRARFTPAHEIGHIKLHLDKLIELTKLPHIEVALARASQTHSDSCDSEVQANRFAAAFLAPDDGLKVLDRDGALDIDTVMKVFGMSRSAALWRIHNYRRAVALRDRRDYNTRRRGGR